MSYREARFPRLYLCYGAGLDLLTQYLNLMTRDDDTVRIATVGSTTNYTPCPKKGYLCHHTVMPNRQYPCCRHLLVTPTSFITRATMNDTEASVPSSSSRSAIQDAIDHSHQKPDSTTPRARRHRSTTRSTNRRPSSSRSLQASSTTAPPVTTSDSLPSLVVLGGGHDSGIIDYSEGEEQNEALNESLVLNQPHYHPASSKTGTGGDCSSSSAIFNFEEDRSSSPRHHASIAGSRVSDLRREMKHRVLHDHENINYSNNHNSINNNSETGLLLLSPKTTIMSPRHNLHSKFRRERSVSEARKEQSSSQPALPYAGGGVGGDEVPVDHSNTIWTRIPTKKKEINITPEGFIDLKTAEPSTTGTTTPPPPPRRQRSTSNQRRRRSLPRSASFRDRKLSQSTTTGMSGIGDSNATTTTSTTKPSHKGGGMDHSSASTQWKRIPVNRTELHSDPVTDHAMTDFPGRSMQPKPQRQLSAPPSTPAVPGNHESSDTTNTAGVLAEGVKGVDHHHDTGSTMWKRIPMESKRSFSSRRLMVEQDIGVVGGADCTITTTSSGGTTATPPRSSTGTNNSSTVKLTGGSMRNMLRYQRRLEKVLHKRIASSSPNDTTTTRDESGTNIKTPDATGNTTTATKDAPDGDDNEKKHDETVVGGRHQRQQPQSGGIYSEEIPSTATVVVPESKLSQPISLIWDDENDIGKMKEESAEEENDHDGCILHRVQELFVKDGFGLNDGTYSGSVIQSTNIPHGKGILEYYNGCTFEGRFVDGLKRYGTMRYRDGSIYHGQFVTNGTREGHGQYTFPNGVIYRGEFQKDHMHGPGTMIWSNGSRFVGYWKKGIRHGPGRSFQSNGLLRKEGVWKDGILIDV